MKSEAEKEHSMVYNDNMVFYIKRNLICFNEFKLAYQVL